MPKPYLHISRTVTLPNIIEWLKELKYKVSVTTDNIVLVHGFGKVPIILRTLPCDIIAIKTPLGSTGYIDHVSSNKRNLLFYYRDFLQFSTELFNV